MNRSRYVFFSIATLLTLVFSALSVAPVLADDSPPPVEAATVEPPQETPPPVAETVPEVTAPTQEPALLPELPEGTELVVVDENGESVPLATQAAADSLAIIDPVWCPVGIAPKTDGSSGCTTSYSSLQALVSALMTGSAGVTPGKNGIIWIQAGADASAGAIELDGSDVDLGTMETFALTLQGGWSGVHNSPTISGNSTINQSLLINNWAGDITLKDIIFSGVTVGSSVHSAALDINTTKKISLTNVNVANNTGGGTVNGAYLGTDGDVAITNSTFTDNKNAGLTVISDGAIAIVNLVANNNGAGAYLDNSGAVTAKTVTLSGNSNQAKFNGGDGLIIYSKGAITINSITANNNGSGGVFLDNHGYGSPAMVKFTGTNAFNQNGDSGLGVFSDGAVSINNATGNQNGIYGLYVDNHTSTKPQAVTLSVSGGNPDTEFNDNFGGNVYIASNGSITITGLDAAGSGGGIGVFLQNDYAGAVGGITITGWGIWTGYNSSYGLYALSKGAITISALFSSGNGMDGAYLDNTAGTAPIKITGSVNVNGNGVNGLSIHSKGAVTLNNLSAEDNSGTGVSINNSTAATPQSVLLSGTSNFNRNQGWAGLEIFSQGTITLNNVNAYDNNNFGVTLDNCLAIAPTYTACAVVKAAAITLNGNNYFAGNGASGLDISSKGNVIVNNVDSNSNGEYGALLNNQYSGAVGMVSIKNTPTAGSYFQWNGLDGLLVFSNSNITLMDVVVVGNGQTNYNNADNGDPIDHAYGYGAYLTSDVGNVSVGSSRKNWCNSFSNNFQSGLTVLTDGAVTLSNLCNSGNGGYFNVTGFDPGLDEGYGAYVDNSSAATPKPVTLLGNNQFDYNAEGGLSVFSKGAIKTGGLGASSNGESGIVLNNNQPGASGGVTVGDHLGGDDNGATGVAILSKGAITINVIDAWGGGNTVDGWYLDNSFVGAVGGITLTTANPDWGFDFWGNGANGFTAYSLGAIKISGLDAGGNGGNGAVLSNAFVGSIGTITVTAPKVGENGFNGNAGEGLIVTSNRAITVGNLSANNNGAGGAVLNNTFSSAASPQNVTLTGYGDFHNNGDNGLSVLTFGAILGNNIHASYNGQNLDPSTGWGAYLDNCGYISPSCTLTVAPKSITLTGSSSFDNNNQDGLWATSMGAITLKQISANGNSASGAYLDNNWTNAVGGISLTSATPVAWNYFTGNGFAGLLAFSNGAITLNNLQASSNGDIGASVFSEATVTISGRNMFNYNDDDPMAANDGGNNGLEVTATGNITLSNLTANGNDGLGVNLYTVAGNITLTGANTFNQNYTSGLFADSYGALSMTNVTADANGNTGVYGSSAVGGITLTCGSMTANASFGWAFDADTTITLKGVFLSGNGFALLDGTLVQSRICP